MSKFAPYNGDLIGLPTDENHLNFRWKEDDCKILFSVTRLGNGASCHLASDKRGLRRLKEAVNEFADYVFFLFPWCEMILAKIKPKSVMRLVEQCGFEKTAVYDNFVLYTKLREVNQ